MSKPWTIAHTAAQLLLAGAALLAFTTSSADSANSGIVEESLGGAGTAFVVGLLWIALPAVAVGLLDGLLALRSGAVRAGVRALVIVVLSLWGGLFVPVATELECDGTCTEVPTGVLLTALAAVEIGVLGSWGLGRVLVLALGRRPTPSS